MEIPKLALGTFKADNEQQLIDAVRYAVEDAGYRHIDTAYHYYNQVGIGKALAQIFANGKVKREELFITTKLSLKKHHEDDVVKNIQTTLQDLQLDYIDLFLIHCPTPMPDDGDSGIKPRKDDGTPNIEHVDILETWRGMEKCVELGFTKHIGVCNFTINMLERMRYSPEVKIQPYCHQFECHIYMQQEPMIDYCTKRSMYCVCYCPLGAAEYRQPNDPVVLDDPVLKDVADRLGQPIGSVALKFCLQLSPVCCVIAKSTNPKRIDANARLDFVIPDSDMMLLRSRERMFRFYDFRKIYGLDVHAEGYL